MRKPRLLPTLLLACLPLAAIAAGDPPPPAAPATSDALPASGAADAACPPARLAATGDRPRVGLVLSGGGARGAAHVGVLKAIEAHGIPVDLVVGTSMGSIIGGLYAAGMPLPELEKLLVETDWPAVLDDAPPRSTQSLRRKAEDRAFSAPGRVGISRQGLRLPAGAHEGHHVGLMLRRLTAAHGDTGCFAGLPLPFAAVATDAQSGRMVVLDRGDLATALRASMAIPGYFSPVERDGRLLVDGGIANNLPVSLARQMGADVVIAVDVGAPLAGREKLRDLLGISLQMTVIQSRRGADAERATLGADDLLIEPEMPDVGTFDFTRMARALQAGEQAAQAVLASSPLRAQAAAGSTPAARHGAQWLQSQQARPLHRVAVAGDSLIPAQQVIDRLGIDAQAAIDQRDIQRAIDRVQGMDYFSRVDYRFDADGTLTVLPQDRDWGPHYLQFGLALYNDFAGIDRHQFGISYTGTRLNHLSGQLYLQGVIGDTRRLFAELHQPLTRRAHTFVAPWALYNRSNRDLYAGDDPQARLEGGSEEAGIDLGLTRRYAEWRLGLAAGTRRQDTLVSALPVAGFRSTVAYARLTGFLDTFDHRDFPGSGSLLRLLAEQGRQSLGAEDDYELATLQFDHAWTLGRHALVAGIELKTQETGAGIELEPQQLGGTLRMSAFAPGELAGEHAAMLRVVLRRPLSQWRWLRAHGGLSLEYGGAWNGDLDDARDDALWPVLAAFAGLDTPLGPLWLVGGISEHGRAALQMQLGTRF